MAKKRCERVKEKLLKQRNARIKDKKEKAQHDNMAYLSRKKKTPIIRKNDSILVRNNKKLQDIAADHAALLQFREENQGNAEEQLKALKQEYDKTVGEINDTNNN